MDERLLRLLVKERPTARDVAEARQLANGRFENRLWAMDQRRQDAYPTPVERKEAKRGAAEMAAALAGRPPEVPRSVVLEARRRNEEALARGPVELSPAELARLQRLQARRTATPAGNLPSKPTRERQTQSEGLQPLHPPKKGRYKAKD